MFACLLLRGCAVFVLMMFSWFAYANDDYSDGFKAYIDGDYTQAQSKWLQSAKQGDAKSMFNLGLLHEQGRIDDADENKAMEWYRLAGSAGYSPANYHLALTLLSNNGDSQENKEQALLLMGKAAANGFKPAVDYVNKGSAINVLADKNESNASSQKTPPIVEVKAEEANQAYLSEQWVIAKKPSYWTIQLLAFKDEENVQAFIDKHDLKDSAVYFKERSGGKVLYKLLYGAYKTKIQADFARQNLAKELAQHGPWLRTIESVQSAIKAK